MGGSFPLLDRSSLGIGVSTEDGLHGAIGAQTVTCDVEASATDERQLFELINHTSEQVLQQITQEHLDPLDGTARMPVPVLDFDLPDPDWKTYTATSKDMFFYLTQAYDSHFNVKPCRRNFRQDKELRWIPFPPRAAIVDLEEAIGDPAEVTRQLGISNRSPSPTDADCVPPRAGLRFIHPDDVDDVIPTEERESSTGLGGDTNISTPSTPLPVVMTPPSDDELMTLVRKRKYKSKRRTASLSGNSLSPLTREPPLNTSHLEPLFTSKDDPHATEKLLSSYISMRAPKKAKLTTNRHFPSDVPRTRNQTKAAHSDSQAPKNDPTSYRWPAPRPQFHPPAESVRLIISITAPRSLMTGLRNHLPAGVEFLDRDLYHRRFWNPTQGNQDPKEADILPLDSEADVVVSPSTGIIATTLLRVRQKPLPGSGSTISRICERIAKVAPLYDRLIVLVSEDAQDETTGQLSEADAHAYSDFVRFVMSLEGTSVQTFFVPGGPSTLGAWAAWVACENLPSVGVQKMLCVEETKWETFLRASGLNVYAAQVLTRHLEERHGGEGLMRFLQMSRDEKVKAFQGSVLTTGLLARASDRLHGHRR